MNKHQTTFLKREQNLQNILDCELDAFVQGNNPHFPTTIPMYKCYRQLAKLYASSHDQEGKAHNRLNTAYDILTGLHKQQFINDQQYHASKEELILIAEQNEINLG